jgi:hypothetical protein
MVAMKIRIATLMLLFMAAFSPQPQLAPALDLQARVETRYQLQAGDGAIDNDVFQYHSLELPFLKSFSFGWSGGLRKDLDGQTDGTASAEGTDIALRGLPDAANADQTFEYRIYSAFLRFDAGRFGALAGRCNPQDYELSQFDGLLLWASPLEWLRLETFGGKPWHYGYLSDFSTYWEAGELVIGAGAEAALLDESLRLALRYVYLRELTRGDALIGEAADTYIASDHLSKLRATWAATPWLETGGLISFLDLAPRSANVWASGNIEPLLASYSLGCAMQFIDIADLSDRLTMYSALLGASHPYLSVSASLNKDFSDLLGLKGFFTALQFELGYEHRQPRASKDRSMFNPQYDQFRVGTLLAIRGDWSLLVDYNFLLSSGLENNLHVVGGELAKKWEKIELRVGSSFYANRFQSDYTETVFTDSFYAQEYYLKVKWRISRAFDLSLRGTYEHVLLSSLTSLDKVNDLVVYEPVTELFSEPRDYFRLDIRTGYRY